jgi:hypothetical protein
MSNEPESSRAPGLLHRLTTAVDYPFIAADLAIERSFYPLINAGTEDKISTTASVAIAAWLNWRTLQVSQHLPAPD